MFAIFVGFTALAGALSLADPRKEVTHRRAVPVVLGLSALVLIQVAVAPIEPGSDLDKYFWNSVQLGKLEPLEALRADQRGPLFVLTSWGLGAASGSQELFKVFWGLAYLGPLLLALRHLLAPWQTLLTFWVYVNLPIFFEYVNAAVRQGVAMSLLLVGLAFALSGRSKLMYTTIVCAALFHISAAPIGACIVLAKALRGRPLVPIAVWIGSIISFLFVAQAEMLDPLIDASGMLQAYASEAVIGAYGGANKLEFLLVSVSVGAVGLVGSYLLRPDAKYTIILNYYLLSNSVFLLFGFLAFSDRIAAYSWFLIPLIAGYPILTTKASLGWHPVALWLVALLGGATLGSFAVFY